MLGYRLNFPQEICMFMRTRSNDSQVTVNLGQARKKGTPEQGTYEILLEVGWPGHLPSKFWFDAKSQDIGHPIGPAIADACTQLYTMLSAALLSVEDLREKYLPEYETKQPDMK